LKSKWVGEGEANIRRLFARARATAPSVIVFDEMDSIASARSGNTSDGASQAAHSMVNQLLTEMDGFRKEQLVLVVGTTNFVDCLDPAFLRPGRFEYQIEIPYPDWEDRKAILALYNRVFDTGISEADLEMLAGWTGRMTDLGTPYTGDHLNALIRNLKRHLINTGKEKATSQILIDWLNKQAGSAKLEPAEERVVAVHECGHALLYCKCNRIKEIKKVTLESGSANTLGMVQREAKKPNLFFTESKFKEEIGILLGGYGAEKVVFGETSTGASQDLKRATSIASDMVAVYGMGGNPVPRSYTDDNYRVEPFFIPQLSPRIEQILSEILAEVTAFLTEYRSYLDIMTEALIKKRTLDQKDLVDILKGNLADG